MSTTCTRKDLEDFFIDLVKDNLIMGEHKFAQTCAEAHNSFYTHHLGEAMLRDYNIRKMYVRAYLDSKTTEELNDWTTEHLGETYAG